MRLPPGNTSECDSSQTQLCEPLSDWPPSWRIELAANETRLCAAWGDPLPPATPAVLQQAEAAVAQLSGHSLARSAGKASLAGWAQGINPRLLASLAAAFRQSQDVRFASAAREIYTAGLEADARDRNKAKPIDPLIIPHRLGDTECVGWFGALPAFLEADCFDDPFVAGIVACAQRNLNDLTGALHPARNIRMTQMDALLTQALRLRFLPDAALWQSVGLRGLNDCFFRQFNPDGSSIEATGWYHYIVANMALRFLRLKQAMPDLALQVTPDLVARAFTYTAAMIAPDGTFNRIGDSTAIVHPHRTLKDFLHHRDDVLRELQLDPVPPPCLQFYPDAGQLLLRDSWSPDGTYITFDATRRMGYHWHPACNALQLQIGHHRLLADPGRLRYDPTPHRKMATGTRAHSTLNLNGWNQSDASAQMTFKSSGDHVVATGLYSGGYWPMCDMEHGRGIYASHHRILLWIRARCLVVIDSLYHTEGQDGKPDIEINWQLGPGSRTRLDPDNRRVLCRQEDAGLMILFAETPPDAELHLHEGEQDPCLGWIADHNDQPIPAPLLRTVLPTRNPWRTELATVLIPFTGEREPGVSVISQPPREDRSYGQISLHWDDGTGDTILWSPRLESALACTDPVRTDAALVHLHSATDGITDKALVYEGSYLEPLLAPGRADRNTFTITNPAR